MRFIVLGGYGIIGRAVVRDLFESADGEIIIAGRNLEEAKRYAKSFNSKRVTAAKVEISDRRNVVRLLGSCDVCVNCLQYNFNIQVMRACIEGKTNYVDLGGLFHETRKQLKLKEEFNRIGKTAIIGMGGAPGITNVLAAYGGNLLNNVKSLEITFADRDETNYDHKFVLPYSFRTIVEEYALKPAVFSNGKIKFAEPQSGKKEYFFGDGFGKQNGFLTLHSEIATLPEYFKGRGIKKCEFRVTFPEEFNKEINSLIELGLTSKDNVGVNGATFPIIDYTSLIMNKFIPSKKIKIKDGEIIRVDFNKGELVLDAVTKSDEHYSAGVLDTAIPCSIAAQMIARKWITDSGVFPPEKVIKPELFFKELKKRGIEVTKNGKRIN